MALGMVVASTRDGRIGEGVGQDTLSRSIYGSKIELRDVFDGGLLSAMLMFAIW